MSHTRHTHFTWSTWGNRDDASWDETAKRATDSVGNVYLGFQHLLWCDTLNDPYCVTNTVDPNTRAVQLLGTRTEDAFSRLYDMYADALFGVISRILRSEALAEEALQDSFVKIWKYAPNYDPSKGRVFTWMMQIARNTAIDYTRSAKFQNAKKTETLEPLVYENESLATNPEVRDIGLRKVIESIDPKYRKLIELVYFQGFTHSDVQKELDIPLGTVKTRLRKAILVLRELLGKEGLLMLILILWLGFLMISRMQ